MTTRGRAAEYFNRGWAPVPIPRGSKAPVIKDWPNYRIDSPEDFPNGPGNLGVILGQASNGLVCVDLDDPDAVELAPQYLPPTDLIAGRTSVPGNHWFYEVRGELKKHEFKHKVTEQKFLELLADGQQVVVGPSIHPSGDVYDDLDGHAAEVDPSVLIECCTQLYHAVCDRKGLDPYAGEKIEGEQKTKHESANGDILPGADFNDRGNVRDLLVKHGWKPNRESGNREYWTRPGKTHGISATLISNRVLFVFTSATGFDSSCGYSPFAVYARLEHNGSFEQAGKELYKLGFGSRRTTENTKKGNSCQQTPQNTAENRGRLLDAQIFNPFPMEILPGVIREFCEETARIICCDSSLVLLPALAVMATAIGNSRRVVVRHSWSEPAIIWTMAVADSGSGKSPAFDAATAPLKKIQKAENRAFESKLSEYKLDKATYDEKKKEDKSTPEPRIPVIQDVFLENTTVEAIGPALISRSRGSAIICEELSGWFKQLNAYKTRGGGDEAFYLQAHGGRDTKINRKGGPPLFIPAAVLSITGTIQRQILKDVLSGAHLGSGMAARFWFSMPPEQKRQWSEREISQYLIEQYDDLIHGLSRLDMRLHPIDDPEPHYIGMSKSAQQRFVEFYNDIGAARPDIETSEMKAAWAKLEGGAARIALVLSTARYVLGERKRELVELEDIEAGIIASKWFAKEAERIYSMLSESPEDKELCDLIDWISTQGGSVLPRDLAQRKRRYREAGAADAVLQKLVKREAGVWSETTTTELGGRPARRFILTQAVRNLTHENQLQNRGLLPQTDENGGFDQFGQPNWSNENEQSDVDLSAILETFR